MVDLSNEIVVRPTLEEDWFVLKTVRLASLLDSPQVFSATYTSSAQYSDLQWRDRAAGRTPFHYFLALHRNEAVGIVAGTLTHKLEFNVVAMWVNAAFRGLGVADQLITAIKQRAMVDGHQRMVLSVSPNNLAAVKLYIRHGFEFIDEWETVALASGHKNQKMQCCLITAS